MPSAVEECCETLGKCQGIVREFHIVWRVVTLRIILHVLVQMGSLLQLFYFCLSGSQSQLLHEPLVLFIHPFLYIGLYCDTQLHTYHCMMVY